MKKYEVTDVQKKGNIERVEFQNGKYIVHVPKEANLEIKKKFSIMVSETEDELPSKTIVQLLGSVIRKNSNFSLVSAGGLLCQIPEKLEIDTSVYIVIF